VTESDSDDVIAGRSVDLTRTIAPTSCACVRHDRPTQTSPVTQWQWQRTSNPA